MAPFDLSATVLACTIAGLSTPECNEAINNEQLIMVFPAMQVQMLTVALWWYEEKKPGLWKTENKTADFLIFW